MSWQWLIARQARMSKDKDCAKALSPLYNWACDNLADGALHS